LCSFVREAEIATGRVVAVLADLQGPKIRLGMFEHGDARLATGEEFVISTAPIIGSAERASTTYSRLACDVGAGDVILVDDGMVRLDVVSTNGREIRCRVVEGGLVGDHKGLNLPGVHITAPALTTKDLLDLRFALDIGADVVALSFVRTASDIDPVRAVMNEVGRTVPVLAKIEQPEAVALLDDVLAAFDGLIVARGDLGVELPLQQVPLVQKRSIQAAREQSKPVVVATQMLESMITAPVPTRAEVSDVATAIFEGADAVMLSAESAAGQYPAEAVATMNRIAEEVERDTTYRTIIHAQRADPEATGADAIAAAARSIGETLDLSAIVCWTSSGSTALRVARERPAPPIVAI
jgi:pyruvate kinase